MPTADTPKHQQKQSAGLAQLVEQRFCNLTAIQQYQSLSCKIRITRRTIFQRLSRVCVKRPAARFALAAALVLNPAVTPETAPSTMCAAGWSASVRPPPAYTQAWERAHLPRRYDPRLYVVDHRIPISLGGHPTDPRNLQSQAVGISRAKDRDAARLRRAVCSGRMGLRQAQDEMDRLWPAGRGGPGDRGVDRDSLASPPAPPHPAPAAWRSAR